MINRKTIKSFKWYILKLLSTVLISLFITRELVSLLGVDIYGSYALLLTVVGASSFVTGAVASTSIRFLGDKLTSNTNELRVVFKLAVIVHISIGFVLVILFGLLSTRLGDFFSISPDSASAYTSCLKLFAVIVFMQVAVSPFESMISLNEDMHYLAVLGIVEVLFRLISVYVIYYFEVYLSPLLLLVIILLLSTTVTTFFKVFICLNKYRALKGWSKAFLSNSPFVDFCKHAGWTFLGSSTSSLNHYGQGIILNKFFGTTANAAQGVAGQASGQLGAPALIVSKIFSPKILSVDIRKDYSQLRDTTYYYLRVIQLVLGIFYIPIFISAEEILALWLGNPMLYLSQFLVLLLVRNLIENMSIGLQYMLARVDEIKSLNLFNTINSLVSLIIILVLFWQDYPPVYWYAVFLVTSIIQLIFVTQLARRLTQLNYSVFILTMILPISLIYLASVLVGLYVKHSFAEPFIGLFVGVIIFTGLYFRLVIRKEDVGEFKKVLFGAA